MIDAISVIGMSIQSFTKLVGIGSKSDDLHGANRRRSTSSSVTQVTFCKAFLVSGGLHTLEHEPEEKEEQMMEIIFMKTR